MQLLDSDRASERADGPVNQRANDRLSKLKLRIKKSKSCLAVKFEV